MSDFIRLGLDQRPPGPEGSDAPRPRPAPRAPSPPFRRRSRRPPSTAAGARSGAPLAGPVLEGLSRGGTADVLAGATMRSRYAPAAISAAFHLLLGVILFGDLAPFPEAEPRVVEAVEEREPLLYAFEAPPIEEVEAVPVPPPVEVPEPEAIPEEAAPAPEQVAGLAIPEAQIETPSTGFQNSLPFADGQDEEFYLDERMGEDPDSSDPESGAPTDFDPGAALSPAELAALAEAVAAAEAEAAREAAVEEEEALPPAGVAEPAFDPDDSRLLFDEDAFRRRINDPSADVRRMAEEMAASRARALAERERRREGVPTDIWRFLEGKRFRNPEGGLVSNRNNTLYYDDRGANLVPWISRLIAEVRSNWYVPYAASYERGHVAIAISVLRSGELSWLQVVIPSGVPGFDNAAVGALRGARLLPLPDDYPGADFEIMLVFWYNERPYDLFGQ